MYVFRADSIVTGGHTLYSNKPVVYTSLSNENLIGNPIIKDFIVTLNFPGNELYLTSLQPSQALDGWSSFGFKMEYQNEKVIITSIYEGMAAQKAGLAIEDEVISADGQMFDCKDYCRCRAVIDTALNNKTAVLFKVNQRGNIKEITVKKEKFY